MDAWRVVELTRGLKPGKYQLDEDGRIVSLDPQEVFRGSVMEPHWGVRVEVPASVGNQHQMTAPADQAVQQLLATRRTTHGEFRENALITQRIKDVLHDATRWTLLGSFQKEALDMIAHKMGRIVAGNPDFHDHWDDIAGYARLVSDRIPHVPAPKA